MAAARLYIGGTSSDIAPVAALPTTAAHLVLWNGDKTKTYSVSSIGCTTTTSPGAVIGIQMLANMLVGPVGLPAGTAALGPTPTDGVYPNSAAQVLAAVTIVNTGIWHPVGMSVNTAGTADIALGTYQLVQGIYSIPPGSLLALAVFCSAAASAKCKLFVTWAET